MLVMKIAGDADKSRDMMITRQLRQESEGRSLKERRIEALAEKYLQKEITSSAFLDSAAAAYRS